MKQTVHSAEFDTSWNFKCTARAHTAIQVSRNNSNTGKSKKRRRLKKKNKNKKNPIFKPPLEYYNTFPDLFFFFLLGSLLLQQLAHRLSLRKHKGRDQISPVITTSLPPNTTIDPRHVKHVNYQISTPPHMPQHTGGMHLLQTSV